MNYQSVSKVDDPFGDRNIPGHYFIFDKEGSKQWSQVLCQLTNLMYNVKVSDFEGLMYSFHYYKFMNIGLKRSYTKLVFPAIVGSDLGEN